MRAGGGLSRRYGWGRSLRKEMEDSGEATSSTPSSSASRVSKGKGRMEDKLERRW